jgi:hypothetical protein
MIPQYSLYLAGNGRQVVSTAGTAVPLSTTSVPCCMVAVVCISTNTEAIVIGTSTAKATTGANRSGITIWPGSTTPLHTFNCTDLANVYIDGLSTEGISFVYYSITNP